MPSLNPHPGTITKAQLAALHAVARKRGLDRDTLHHAAGVESLTTLGAAAASALIKHLGGGGLPNPPGKKPIPSRTKRSTAAVRMITRDQVEQITRLGLEYFAGDAERFVTWLMRFKPKPCFDVSGPARDIVRGLGTADRAGQVIRVLKEMTERQQDRTGQDSQDSRDEEGKSR